MHISDGVLSAPVLLAGGALAVAGLTIGLRSLTGQKIALCGIMAAVFFLGSLIHVPVGFASAHLLLCGLLGVILGWAAFPAIFTALLLQALLFQYGGLSVLGVNTFCMGMAAVCSWYMFKLGTAIFKTGYGAIVSGFFAGAGGVLFSAFFTACALSFSSEGFALAATALFLAHIPVMIVEGIITAVTAGFIMRVKPQLLGLSY